jgi:hypothetical protein
VVKKFEWHPKLNVLWVFKWKLRVWVVGFGLVNFLALVPFNFHISFHLFYLVFCSWINPQTFGTRLKWGWLNKTPIFDHFPVDSTSHLHTLYCKRFVRLRVLIKTHIKSHKDDPCNPRSPFLSYNNANINCRTGIMKIRFENLKVKLNIFHTFQQPLDNAECLFLDSIEDLVT